jgi:hypothetical protein
MVVSMAKGGGWGYGSTASVVDVDVDVDHVDADVDVTRVPFAACRCNTCYISIGTWEGMGLMRRRGHHHTLPPKYTKPGG